MCLKGRLPHPVRQWCPDRCGQSWGSDFATALVWIIVFKVAIKVGYLWPEHPPPSTPASGNAVCASNFSLYSSLLWQRVFACRSPLGAVRSGEGTCGNLSWSGQEEGEPSPGIWHGQGLGPPLVVASPGMLRWDSPGALVSPSSGPSSDVPNTQVACGLCTPCPGILKNPHYKPVPSPQGWAQEWAGGSLSRRSLPFTRGEAGSSAEGTA